MIKNSKIDKIVNLQGSFNKIQIGFQKMNKINGNLYKKERRERSYSDDENMILSIIKKNKH